MINSLPLPDPDALQHSEQLRQLLIEKIHHEHGTLSFADFMHTILYEPML
jgi:hypothetical protein